MFHLRKKSIDDLLRGTYLELLRKAGAEVLSSKGRSLETFGAALELTDPRCRLSRSIGRSRLFSALGEFLWYVSGSNSIDQIEYYIRGYSEFSDDPDRKTANGAYGPRIFSVVDGFELSQWKNVMSRLKNPKSRETRNAVIVIPKPRDFIADTKDRPCTCSLQFVIRRNRLHMHVHMRSNDAYFGMPHDFFSFTMLQELAAREVGVGIGTYIHTVGSLHLYADPEKLDHRPAAQKYIDEGLYSNTPMPPMPQGDQWAYLKHVLEAESEIRSGNLDFMPSESLPEYWLDLLSLLRIYGCSIHLQGLDDAVRDKRVKGYLEGLHHREYDLYVLDRLQRTSAA